MSRVDRGRALLHQWEAAKPTNLYDDDHYLRFVLTRVLGVARLASVAPHLREAGADAAGPISAAALLLERPESWPRIDAWDAAGQRTDDVVFHPAHHEVGRRVWRSGILSVLREPGNVTAHAALAYLFATNGETPHLCSVACTAGLVKAIQREGSGHMRRVWLPRLLESDYDRRWHAAQFLTEVQGGSDVGANACVARPADGTAGAWRITGEKWFCSNVTADLYAVSARPDGAVEGTPGIGLFVVPRRLEDGRANGVTIRRLKNKLGTRPLPTAELDFDGALGWPLGATHEGFRLLMGVVVNTSRLGVAIGASGIMRRAWIEAFHYARVREAFGRRLAEFPAVRQQLAEMRALGAAGLALTLFVAALEDAIVTAGLHPEDDAVYRTAVNLAKLVTSTDAGRVVHHGMEILGGNGTIEDFSPLPRFYREVPVQESWEGPHNTLVSQLMRDAFRAKMHDVFLSRAEAMLLGVEGAALAPLREAALRALDATRVRLEAAVRDAPERAAYQGRGLVTRVARLMQVALLLEHARHAGAEPALGWLSAAAKLLLDAHLRPTDDPASEPDYPELIRHLTEE
jgi:alkylation response protein AidB-like acyl-CoA dehydrogenase